MKISLPWSLHSSWGKTDKDMVKYRACHMVISDMGTNDAGKRVGRVGERESVMGLFIICLLMCLLKNRHQAS